MANDYFDLAEDRRDRPGRPLPAGEVRPGTAMGVALAAILAAVGLAAWVNLACAATAGALGACAMAYDWRLKRIPVIGPLTMGACRGLSLLLGAAARDPASLNHLLILLTALCLSLYIAAITLIAAGETRRRSLRLIRWGPPAAMIALLVAVSLPTGGFLLFVPAYGVEELWVVTCTLMILAAGTSFAAAERLRGVPPVATVQRTIGQLIRNLLLVHAAVAGGMGHGLIAVALLAAWPASAMLARRFYAS
ncbi:MAG: UbiA family prenyltransferase [Planctomycetota bacterium]|nr:UbiA family prenyltransferase [Planctomycetota bacterium]